MFTITRKDRVYPRYAYPRRALLGLGWQVLAGGRRSFAADARACLDCLQPPLQVLGREHIPARGPALIVVNHYHRPGFDAWWIALAITSVVPVEMHWVMTDELTFPGKWYAALGQAGSRWLLGRLARIYGFTAMPPMPPRPGDVTRRALAVRRLVAYARQHPDAVLGLAPEGRDIPNGGLGWPPPGAGRLIALLAELGFPITPVGAYERDGAFWLHFGPAFQLQVPPDLSATEKDRFVARTVMTAIARLLPEPLKGEFA